MYKNEHCLAQRVQLPLRATQSERKGFSMSVDSNTQNIVVWGMWITYGLGFICGYAICSFFA